VKVYAKYEYTAKDADEISIKPGEEFEMLAPADENG
jgi:hypothetical protein